ncbi:MAG: hypothetical protein RL414_869 [Actinomycetota bacterium]|jgi:hypothetical protein
MLKRLAAGGVAAVVGLGVWGVAGEDHTTRTDSGAIVETGDLGAFATQLGDCFDGLPSGGGKVSTVTGIPCSSAHHWQVVYKGESTLSDYSKTAIDAEVTRVCESAIGDIANGLTDEKYNEYQNAETSVLKPTLESWDKGDRAYDCLVGSDTEVYYTSLIN